MPVPQPQGGGGGGILSIISVVLKNIPRLFAFVFVILIFISTISDGWNKSKETGDPSVFFISLGKAIIKPLISSDKVIFEQVSLFNNPMPLYKKIIAYMDILGAITVQVYIYRWGFKFVNSSFEMASALNVHVWTFLVLFLMVTLYNTASSGKFMVGGYGLYSLFTNFSLVFQPIISVGEKFLGLTNSLPDADVPIFK